MAKSATIYNPSLKKAVQTLLLQMKEAGYSEGTQNNTFKALRPIQTFMDSEGITDYSPQVGTNYLESYFQIHTPSEHCKQSIIRYVELLNKSYAGIQIVKEKSRFIYNESLSELINGLIEQLRTMGFSEETLHNYMVRLRPIQSYMRKNNIDLYSPEVGMAYYNYFLETHNISETTKSELRASILRLNDFYRGVSFVRLHTFCKIDTIPICFKSDTDAFLCDSTIYSDSKTTTARRVKALARFLTKCTLLSAHSISELTPQIVQLACRNVTDIDEWITIRQFLKLLAQKGKTENDLSTFVPKARRETKAPSTYTIEEIQSLEMSIDRNTFQGKRDYVVLLMASRLLMRAGDIASIRLEYIDFNSERISFLQKKTNTEVVLPLVPILKEALEEYLLEADTSDGYLFHTLTAPHTPITGKVVAHIVAKYFNEAGIDTTGKKHGPHTLRASGSTSMINDDISYDIVRHILGHTSPNSIRHYAKNDIEKLRRCAVSVPAPSGKFAEFLNGGVQVGLMNTIAF